MNFANLLEGKMLMVVVVDAKSKLFEVVVVSSSTLECTVVELQDIFARFGLPKCIVTDNGTPYTGEVFQEFLRANDVKHFRAAPYHPASHGLAERAVHTVKDSLKNMGGETLRK